MRNIFLYGLKRWGRAQAEAYRLRLDKSMSLLSEQPYIGRPKQNLFNGCRCVTIEQHEILYHVTSDSVQVVRVLSVRAELPMHGIPH